MAASGVTPAVPRGTAAALQLVKCKVSASLLPANLTVGSKSYAYIHRSEVALVESRLVALGNEKAEVTSRAAYSDKEPLNAVEFVKLAGLGDVLVVLNQAGGVYLFDESGQKLLHSYKHTKSGSGAPASLKELHLRGIATDGKEALFVGCGNGDILVFAVSKAKMTLSKIVPASAEGHQDSAAAAQGSGGVSALTYASGANVLVSGDDWGHLCFWPAVGGDVPAKPAARVEGKGAPVNVLVSGHGLVAAGLASGHIRLLDPVRKGLAVEVAAHTRAINALDMHPSKPLLLSAAEDTFVTVWSLPTAANPQVKNLSAESPALGLLTGARFGGQNHELIVTTIYDSRSLALMHTP